MEINKALKLNMATATKALSEFTGEEGQDIGLWLREVSLISQAVGLQEEEILGLIVVKLRGEARSYVLSLTKGNLGSVNCEALLQGLKKRFGNSKNTDEILQRFLSIRTTESYDEYVKLLKDATILSERGCIALKLLIRLTISKTPSELKTLLFQYACTSTYWANFMQNAEEAAWIAFPEKLNNRVEVKDKPKQGDYKGNKKYQQPTRRYSLFCVIHRKGNHSTDQCYTIKTLEQNGWKRNKNEVSALEEEEKDTQSGKIKNFRPTPHLLTLTLEIHFS